MVPVLTRTTPYTCKTDVAVPIPATTNLLQASQTFDNSAVWALDSATITPNTALAPDSTLTADKLVEDTANNDHTTTQGLITILANTDYTLFCYAKAAERSQFNLTFLEDDSTGGIFTGVFDLPTGAWVQAGGTFGAGALFVNRAFESVGNGWWRLQLAGQVNNTSGRVNLSIGLGAVVIYLGDGASGIHIWGAQLELGLTASIYMVTP